MHLTPTSLALFFYLRRRYCGVNFKITIGAFINVQQIVLPIHCGSFLISFFIIYRQFFAPYRPSKYIFTFSWNLSCIPTSLPILFSQVVTTLFHSNPASPEPFTVSFELSVVVLRLGISHFLFPLRSDFDGRTTGALKSCSRSRIPNRAPAPAVFQPRAHNPRYEHQSHHSRAALAILMTTHPRSPCVVSAPLPIPVPARPETAPALRNAYNLALPYSGMHQARSAALPAAV